MTKHPILLTQRKATAKDRPDVYSLLAALIIERDQDKEFAHRVMDQMIAENPDSADAHLKQSIFLTIIGRQWKNL